MATYSDSTHSFFNALAKDKGASSLLRDDVSVLKLRDFLFQKFNDEWLEWLPETLNITLFGSDQDSILTDKIQAIRICYKTDSPWTEWDIFENVGKAFNHQKPHFGFIQPMTLEECVCTSILMKEMRPEEVFTDEVLSYVGSIAAYENYLFIPIEYPVFKAQKYLDKFVHDNDVQKELAELWPNLAGRPLLEANYIENNMLHQQIVKLALLEQYVKENAYA